MEVPRLNDDVLLSIFSHIHGEDALNVSLSCKRFYELAISRVAARAFCWKPQMGSRLCDYMLSPLGSRPRARHLEVLVLLPNTFFPMLKPSSVTSALTLKTSRIGDVLAEAPGLRVLQWTVDFREHFLRNPRIKTAFRSWTNLNVLELDRVDNEIISLLQSVTSLGALTLRSQVSSEMPGHGQEHSMAILLETLSQLRRLHTLSLWYFRYEDTPLTAEGPSPELRFPSIIDLSLSTCATRYLLLVQRCPNLARVAVAYPVGTALGSQIFPAAALGPRWPPLKSLSISTRDLDLCGIDQLKPVRELRLWDAPFENTSTPDTLVRALPALSPISISLSARFRVDTSPSWDVLANYMRGVRILDVDVNPHAYRPWSDNWHDNVPRALARIPLLSLRLIVHAHPSGGLDARLEDPTPVLNTHRRREALSALPRKVFSGLPTLRLFAMAEEASQPTWRITSGTASGSHHKYMNNGIEELADTSGRRAEWEDLDRARFHCHWWYRATPEGDFSSVTEKEGERAYQAIVDACTNAGARSESDMTADIENMAGL